MYPKPLYLLAVLIGLASLAHAAESVEVRGEVDAVTVYRGQALVTRILDLAGPGGLREVIVTDLPEHIVPGSIYAESANGIEVRSVRYRVRPVQEDVREEVRELDQQIRDLQDKLHENQRYRELNDENKAYIAKLEQFVAPTATVELSKGVLDAETLHKLSDLLMEHRKSWTTEDLRLTREQKGLEQQLQLRQRERNELTGSSARTAREAVVFANLQGDGGQLRVRYLVNNANWSPSYNIRTDADRGNVLVECNASIQQMSGEDWSDVSMTLSTASPSLVAKAPVLEPLTISLTALAQGKKGQAVLAEEQRQLVRRQIDLSNARNTLIIAPQQSTQPTANQVLDLNLQGGQLEVLVNQDSELNRIAGQIQNYELANPDRITRKSGRKTRADQSVTVTYTIDARSSLPSRSDRQLIQIASLPMSGDFYKVATPVLSNFVYEEAQVANGSDIVLLAGPVATYVAGQFVGHGDIPTVAIGESFTVGFGIDSSLRASRELVEKKESIQGGNRVVDFTYRLALENFGTAPASVRLLDRMPKPKKSDIKLTMGTNGKSLSEDPAYRQSEHKKGILRWEVEVPAQAIGPDAQALEYQFLLEYDKQMTIGGLASAAKK